MRYKRDEYCSETHVKRVVLLLLAISSASWRSSSVSVLQRYMPIFVLKALSHFSIFDECLANITDVDNGDPAAPRFLRIMDYLLPKVVKYRD